MSSPAIQLRVSIEGALAHSIPSALTPAARLERAVAPTGVSEVDALLQGGFPVGAITEIVGSLASGRASCAQAFVAQRLVEGQVCAWVDVADSFDPESAAANRVDLERLLWVRCSTGAPPLPRLDADMAPPVVPALAVIAGGGGSPHPRGEGRGLSKAVGSFLTAAIPEKPLPPRRRDKSIGTPGVSNRSLEEAREPQRDRTEQVAYDRLPARRGAYVLSHRAVEGSLAHAEPSGSPQPAQCWPRVCSADEPGANGPATPRALLPRRKTKPWKQLDQALRATDLLLQTGGFAALVLDLGTMPPAAVNRIPMATWFRFRAVADRTRTSVVLLTQHPCAQTSAELVLRTHLQMPAEGTVLTGLAYAVELVRQRFQSSGNLVAMRKGPQRASTARWQAAASWAGAQ